MDSSWIRRLLSDSVYLWACGERADNEDQDPKLSDRLIGWLVLFIQGFAYTMLIYLDRATSNSEAGNSPAENGQSPYLLPSVTGAMYLLIASTTHDVRAGFSLLVDGTCPGHRAFGISLLVVYAVMSSAAVTVLMSTSEDSTSVLLNAVTVLFVADLDEKALKFLSTITQKWRLFWAIESIGISFALALVALFHFGDSSPLLEGNTDVLKSIYGTWFYWGLNPVGVTLASVLLSSSLEAVCAFFSAACENSDALTLGSMAASALTAVWKAVTNAIEGFKREPCFNVILGVWFAEGGVVWSYIVGGLGNSGFPVAFSLHRSTTTPGDGRLVTNSNTSRLVYMSAILATGLAAQAFGVFLRKCMGPRYYAREDGRGDRGFSCADSRVPSLLMGWGIGYWVFSLLFVLSISWPGNGWDNAPFFVTLTSYVSIPGFLIAGMFMVADTNILGKRFGAFVKPAVGILNDGGRVEHWIMVTAFRDMLIAWTAYCGGIQYAHKQWL